MADEVKFSKAMFSMGDSTLLDRMLIVYDPQENVLTVDLKEIQKMTEENQRLRSALKEIASLCSNANGYGRVDCVHMKAKAALDGDNPS